MIERSNITGLILAGGRGSRMGGVDKGLQDFQGRPLVLHALQRLAPQVGPLLINANRNLPSYQALGRPVLADTLPDHPGPLAGVLSGLLHCDTDYLLCVPCDSPHFPTDLAARLAEGLVRADAALAMAATRQVDGSPRPQPVFCLMKKSAVLDDLQRFIAGGQRKFERWAAEQACVQVLFDAAAAFANANTRDELLQLQRDATVDATQRPDTQIG